MATTTPLQQVLIELARRTGIPILIEEQEFLGAIEGHVGAELIAYEQKLQVQGRTVFSVRLHDGHHDVPRVLAGHRVGNFVVIKVLARSDVSFAATTLISCREDHLTLAYMAIATFVHAINSLGLLDVWALQHPRD